MILDSFNIKPEDCVIKQVAKQSLWSKLLGWLK